MIEFDAVRWVNKEDNGLNPIVGLARGRKGSRRADVKPVA